MFLALLTFNYSRFGLFNIICVPLPAFILSDPLQKDIVKVFLSIRAKKYPVAYLPRDSDDR